MTEKEDRAAESRRSEGRPLSGLDNEDELGRPNLKRRDYGDRLRKLHMKPVEFQEWVRHDAQKIRIV
jgi:hypothetical protein